MIQALELHGCMFPGSPLLHLDNDKWKCTVFTNKSCISAVCLLSKPYIHENVVMYMETYQYSSDGYKLKQP